jgi:hypothetical protein
MNTPTPTPTPRTDAEITFTGAYTCTHHNDQMRTACPVCLITALAAECDELRADADELRGDVVRLTAERDRLRAEAQRFQRLQSFINTAAAEMEAGLITFGGIAELRAERDQLRSDCENETKWAAHYLAQSIADKARAERAEAELATEREKAERYRLATLKLDAELAAEREKVRVLEKLLTQRNKDTQLLNLLDALAPLQAWSVHPESVYSNAALHAGDPRTLNKLPGIRVALAATEAKP